jgi:membrane protein DedA with SNARE-associated domain
MQIIDQIRQFLNTFDITHLASLGAWSYFLLAFLVAIEGPIVTLLGAGAASVGLMHPGFVFLAAAVGNLSSDTGWYFLGYIGKIDWVKKFGQRLGVSLEKLERLEKMLHEHAPIILFFSKLTVSPMIPALIATGLIRFPWKRWFPFVFAGEMIWTGSLVLIGFFGIQAARKVQIGMEHIILIGSILFVVFIFILGRHYLKKETQEPEENSQESTLNEG